MNAQVSLIGGAVIHLKKVLIPLPRKHFDPTEVAVPWKILSANQIQISFATPDGFIAAADDLMLTGKRLGLLAPLLMADRNAQQAYEEMKTSNEFTNPLKWSQLNAHDFDGLLLPGGHDKGMREYLESKELQAQVSKYFRQGKPVGAICHGVVLAARSLADNGQSVLHGRKTTSLLESQELTAWAMTRLWLQDYYRTYPVTVEQEVKSTLASKTDFQKGPVPLLRDSLEHLNRGFVLQDGNYLSARWPGDAHRFATEFLKMLR
jgi:protease I